MLRTANAMSALRRAALAATLLSGLVSAQLGPRTGRAEALIFGRANVKFVRQATALPFPLGVSGQVGSYGSEETDSTWGNGVCDSGEHVSSEFNDCVVIDDPTSNCGLPVAWLDGVTIGNATMVLLCSSPTAAASVCLFWLPTRAH
jgi:hypothetical protein